MEIRRVLPSTEKANSGDNRGKTEGQAFKEILDEAKDKEKLHFTKHAKERLESWEGDLGRKRLEILGGAMTQAGEKGSSSALILMKDVAFLVAPKSRTVITVIPPDRMKENVFTSIDSAILAET